MAIEVERKIILGTAEKPMMVLEKHIIKIDKKLLDNAREELFTYAEKSEVGTWGYFPEIKDENNYPFSIKLTKDIKIILGHRLDWKLAFIRVATKESKSEYGGFHIDVDIGVGHKKLEQFKDREIIRALINLYSYPRKLAYIDKTRDELIQEGFKINENKYEILKFPEKMIKTIDIPAINEENLWVLKFCSSQIPHFGLTDEHGHFLAAYGAWTN